MGVAEVIAVLALLKTAAGIVAPEKVAAVQALINQLLAMGDAADVQAIEILKQATALLHGAQAMQLVYENVKLQQRIAELEGSV